MSLISTASLPRIFTSNSPVCAGDPSSSSSSSTSSPLEIKPNLITPPLLPQCVATLASSFSSSPSVKRRPERFIFTGHTYRYYNPVPSQAFESSGSYSHLARHISIHLIRPSIYTHPHTHTHTHTIHN